MSELRGYVVCGEPRSGSTYLTRALGSTGVLGRPVEFGARELAQAAERPPDGGLAPKVEQTLTPNGVYGIKVFSRPFDLAANVRWADALPDVHFIHLERVDLLGQAISNVRAIQTGQYVSAGEARRELRYDARAIARMLMWIAHNQARWRVWFARNGLTPLRLTYEEVTADAQAAAEAVARHIALPTVPRVDLSQVTLDVQRDEVSAAWRRRFVAERRDLAYLDDDLWGVRARLRRLYAAVR